MPETTNLDAALEAVADRIVPGAAPHLARLWSDLQTVDPSLLPATIQSRLADPANALFVRPAQAPPLGSVKHAEQLMDKARHEAGGLPASTEDGKRYDLSPKYTALPNHGTPSGMAAVSGEMAELEALSPRPGTPWNDLTPAERMEAFGRRNRAATEHLSGLVLRPAK